MNEEIRVVQQRKYHLARRTCQVLYYLLGTQALKESSNTSEIIFSLYPSSPEQHTVTKQPSSTAFCYQRAHIINL